MTSGCGQSQNGDNSSGSLSAVEAAFSGAGGQSDTHRQKQQKQQEMIKAQQKLQQERLSSYTNAPPPQKL